MQQQPVPPKSGASSGATKLSDKGLDSHQSVVEFHDCNFDKSPITINVNACPQRGSSGCERRQGDQQASSTRSTLSKWLHGIAKFGMSATLAIAATAIKLLMS